MSQKGNTRKRLSTHFSLRGRRLEPLTKTSGEHFQKETGSPQESTLQGLVYLNRITIHITEDWL